MNIMMAGPVWAERRAAPKPAPRAMCLPVDPASSAVPLGDRPAYPLGEGSP